jgi:hypothetical protein
MQAQYYSRSLSLDEDSGFEEQRLEFGKILGLNGPVSRKVLFAALEDDTYVHNLMVCRRNLKFMNYLLDNPPENAIEMNQTDARWVDRSAKALINWGKTGFSVVDDDTLKLREDACLICPHLIDPGKRPERDFPVRKTSDGLGKRTAEKICEICGCNAGSKMRRSSASCPSKHPVREGINRWGEVIQEKSKA